MERHKQGPGGEHGEKTRSREPGLEYEGEDWEGWGPFLRRNWRETPFFCSVAPTTSFE